MLTSKNVKMFGVVSCLVVLLLASKVFAVTVTWTEIGDAGDTPSSAQTPIGSGALDVIVGNLGAATDTDVFRIYIPNPNIFAIDMIGTSLSPDVGPLGNDTELWVLDAAGNLVFNNDDGGPGFLSQLNAGDLNGKPAGVYLIAYNLFSSVPSSSQLNPIIGWDVNPYKSQTGTVYLNLTGAEFAPAAQGDFASAQAVPEPSSMLLFGIGFIGLVKKLRMIRS